MSGSAEPMNASNDEPANSEPANSETDAVAGEPGNIGDYQSTDGPDKLPDYVLPRTGTDDPDDDSINITESNGPDLNAGPDVDTGAGGTGA